MFRSTVVRPIPSARVDRLQTTVGKSPRAVSSCGDTTTGLGRRALARLGLVAALTASIVSAGASLSAAAASDLRADAVAEGPGSVFESVGAAAVDALTNAHLTATHRDRQRLRVGTIYRVENGFSYTAPQRAAASSPLMRQSIRYRLRSIDVASYVIESGSEKARSGRSNEVPSYEEKRIVDELDPAHRPLYLLTPSLEVVRYGRGGQLRAITSLSDRRPAKPASTVSAAKTALARDEVRCASFVFQSSGPVLAR
jgi:hypothetical protein